MTGTRRLIRSASIKTLISSSDSAKPKILRPELDPEDSDWCSPSTPS